MSVKQMVSIVEDFNNGDKEFSSGDFYVEHVVKNNQDFVVLKNAFVDRVALFENYVFKRIMRTIYFYFPASAVMVFVLFMVAVFAGSFFDNLMPFFMFVLLAPAITFIYLVPLFLRFEKLSTFVDCFSVVPEESVVVNFSESSFNNTMVVNDFVEKVNFCLLNDSSGDVLFWLKDCVNDNKIIGFGSDSYNLSHCDDNLEKVFSKFDELFLLNNNIR